MKNITITNASNRTTEAEPPPNGEFDNVWIVTESNETYKFDFAGKFTKIPESSYGYVKPNFTLPTSYEQIIIDKKELGKIEQAKAERKIDIRFKIISTALFIGIPIVFLINHIMLFFTDVTLILILAGVVHFYFVMDYKIFRNIKIKRILTCVLLSLLVFVLSLSTNDVILSAIATVPLSFVIVLLLASKFLGTKFDNIMNSYWWDRLFYLMLLVFSILISIFVFKPILEWAGLLAGADL